MSGFFLMYSAFVLFGSSRFWHADY